MTITQTDINAFSPHIRNADAAVIEIDNLSKSFGHQEVLKDVTL